MLRGELLHTLECRAVDKEDQLHSILCGCVLYQDGTVSSHLPAEQRATVDNSPAALWLLKSEHGEWYSDRISYMWDVTYCIANCEQL